MKSFVVAALFAMILAAISAQDTDESLKGSEALYLAAPYGAYGAYPYGVPAPGPAAYAAAPYSAPYTAPYGAPYTAPIGAPAAAPGPAPYPTAAYYFRR